MSDIELDITNEASLRAWCFQQTDFSLNVETRIQEAGKLMKWVLFSQASFENCPTDHQCASIDALCFSKHSTSVSPTVGSHYPFLSPNESNQQPPSDSSSETGKESVKHSTHNQKENRV